MSYFILILCALAQITSAKATEAVVEPSSQVDAENLATKESSDSNSDTRNSKRKKLLDAVQNGVVIINVKSYSGTDQPDEATWAGSGFIVNREKGIIATNRHVAGKNSICTYEVKLSDGSTHKARLLHFDPLFDFAFLVVNADDLPQTAIELELSDKPLETNDTIYAMGNSWQDEFSTFKGTVFSTLENIGPFPEQSFKFSGITAGGASGSPVFDDEGKVAGIIYGGKFISGAGLPISYIKEALEKLNINDKPTRYSMGAIPAYMNIKYLEEVGQLPGEAAQEYLKLFPECKKKILVVDTCLTGSSAQNALKSGDILWKINGQMVGPDLEKLSRTFNQSKEQTLKVDVYRGGQLTNLEVTCYPISTKPNHDFVQFAGAMWHMADEYLRYQIGYHGEGVYIQTASRTSALKKIWSEGWFSDRPIRVTHINGKAINNLDALRKLIPELRKSTMFSLTFIDFMGHTMFGNFVSADRQPRFYIAQYDAKFDKPKSIQWNPMTLEWDLTPIE